MKRIFLIAILGLFSAGTLYAQQIPLYSQYYFNPFIYNPAMTGTDDKANVFLINRAQWANIPGAPVTTALTLDGPIKAKKVGLGISLFSDVTDITERLGAYASYSYRLKFMDVHNLLFGLSLGVIDNRMDYSKLIYKDKKDQLLFAQPQRKAAIDANFGVMYIWKNLEIGIAVPQIMANSLEYKYNDSRSFYNLSRHYLTSVKYTFDINPEKNISVYPLVLMRYVPGAPIQYDINAVFNWENTAWLSLSYRSDYAVGINARIMLHNQFSVGYTYELITNSLSSYAGTSHEIMIGFMFGGSGVKEPENNKYQEEIDSLSAKLQETEKQLERRRAVKLPSQLTTELEELNEEFDKYKEEINDSINKIMYKSIVSSNEIVANNESNTGFISKTSPSEYFVDQSGKEAAKGYYLVIASFKNWDRKAEDLKKDFTSKGHKIVYNKIRKWNYVYASKPDTYRQALKELTKARNSEFPTAWIHILK